MDYYSTMALVRDIIHDVWVIVGLICVLFSFVLSLYSICHGKREAFNIVYFFLHCSSQVLF